MSDYDILCSTLTARGVHYNVADASEGLNGRVITVFTKETNKRPLPVAKFVFDYGQQRLRDVLPIGDEHLLTGAAYTELGRLSSLSPHQLRQEAVEHRPESLEDLKEWNRDKLIPFLFSMWVNKKTARSRA